MKNTRTNNERTIEMANEMVMRTILSSATKIGNKTFINVPIDLLQIDEDYQREIGSKVNKIVAEYDANKMRAGLCSYRDNQFWLIDGQNRRAALKKLNIQTMCCELVEGLTKGEEAALFVSQNDNVTKLNPAEKINGRSLNPDDIFAVTIKEICSKYQLTYGKRGKCPYRNLASISRMEELYKTGGKKALYYFVETVEKAGYMNKSYIFSAVITKMFERIWRTYGDSKTEQLIIMLQSFKEVEFLVSKAKEHFFNVGTEKAVAEFAIQFLK